MQNIGQNWKTYSYANNIKTENTKLNKVRIENHTRYYFDGITKPEDLDFDNILIDDKSNKNILIYNILYKNLIGGTPSRIRFNKVNEFIRVSDITRYFTFFV